MTAPPTSTAPSDFGSSPVTDRPVCVTGASGFIASQIVAQLLERGYRVRGTVRDATAAGRYGFLSALPGAEQRLELVSADLLQPESFVPAVAGCSHVLHTASPYEMDVDDAVRDLVEPALRGTRGVLDAALEANRAGDAEIRRIVLTSSVAAITDEPPDRVLTEDDWNETSSPARNPYYFSKTQAERAAWRWMDDHDPEFDLVVINPFLVIGPSLTPSLNTSNRILVDIVRGKYPGILPLTWGVVDVRDVARAHVLAMEDPEASGRHLTAHATLSMRQLVDEIRALGYAPGGRLPSLGLDNPLGTRVARLASHLQPAGTGSYLRTHLGRVPRFDNRKVREELGLSFRPLDDTLADTLADLVRWGHLPLPLDAVET